MRRPHTTSPAAVEAARLLGSMIRLARRERRWTVEELAERVGVNHTTMRRVEQGALTVGLGVAFEAAAVLGVPLFGDGERRATEAAHVAGRLALLPQRAKRPVTVDNAF